MSTEEAGPARDESGQDPWRHQRQLAESLVRNLGFDDAVDACRRNGWCGVLRVLLDDRHRPAET